MTLDEKLSNLEKRVLLVLQQFGTATAEQIMQFGQFSQLVEVMNAASWLKEKGLVEIKEHEVRLYSLGPEGERYVQIGLPERRALTLLIGTRVGRTLPVGHYLTPFEVGIAIGWLKRKGFIEISKDAVSGEMVITPTQQGIFYYSTQTPDEAVLHMLAGRELEESYLDPQGLAMLKKRSNVIKWRTKSIKTIMLTPVARELLITTPLTLKSEVSQLTHEMLKSGRWMHVELRKYDVTAFAPIAHGGKIHPLTQLAEEIREIFIAMGFKEIEGPYVISNFWNMDILFMPQDHPARDAQDTFYLQNPERFELDKKLASVVKSIHEHGGSTGSKGWRYEWNAEEGAKAVLRTHTTPNTIRYLADHPEPPVKVFSIEKAFRRENMDYKHLPEFIQIEGIVMEHDANLSMLIGILKEFYRRMGCGEVRVRPSYFPFTEPSLEVCVEYKGEWLELGGAGIFRPEVTAPFGIKAPVLAWGLGLERLAMLKFGLKDIRELYFSDIEWLKSRPLLVD